MSIRETWCFFDCLTAHPLLDIFYLKSSAGSLYTSRGGRFFIYWLAIMTLDSSPQFGLIDCRAWAELYATLGLSMRSVLQEMVRRQRSPKILLATDIDNTWITNFHDHLVRPVNLMADLMKQNVPVAYVTGNSLAGVLTRIQSGELPVPAAIAPWLGTQIWLRDAKGDFVRDAKYAALVRSFNFDCRAIIAQGRAFIAQQPNAKLQFQPHHTDHKVSFYFWADSAQAVRSIKRLAEDWFNFSIVICEELDYNHAHPQAKMKKYCLDVVPATKATAVDYLDKVVAADFTIVAGDSGNDIQMLTQSGDLSVIVGGARSELVQAIQAFIAQEDGTRLGYFSQVADRLFYHETDDRLGPESIRHALDLIQSRWYTAS